MKISTKEINAVTVSATGTARPRHAVPVLGDLSLLGWGFSNSVNVFIATSGGCLELQRRKKLEFPCALKQRYAVPQVRSINVVSCPPAKDCSPVPSAKYDLHKYA